MGYPDNGVADDQLRAFFERWQRLEEEKDAISGDLREMFAEAKANGFDTKVLRAVFRDKVGDQSARSEFEAVYDLYWTALGTDRATGARPAQDSSTAARMDVQHDRGSKPMAPADLQAGIAMEPAGTQAPPVETISEPETVSPPPLTVSAPGDESAAPPSAALVVPFRTHNPETHFLNSKGLERLHGCLKPEVCGSSQPRVKRCFDCSLKHDGPAQNGAVA